MGAEEGKGAQPETPRHQWRGSGAARPATLRQVYKIKGTEPNKELVEEQVNVSSLSGPGSSQLVPVTPATCGSEGGNQGGWVPPCCGGGGSGPEFCRQHCFKGEDSRSLSSSLEDRAVLSRPLCGGSRGRGQRKPPGQNLLRGPLMWPPGPRDQGGTTHRGLSQVWGRGLDVCGRSWSERD